MLKRQIFGFKAFHCVQNLTDNEKLEFMLDIKSRKSGHFFQIFKKFQKKKNPKNNNDISQFSIFNYKMTDVLLLLYSKRMDCAQVKFSN